MHRYLPLLLLLAGCPDPAATDPSTAQPGQPNGQPADPNAQPNGQPGDPNAQPGGPPTDPNAQPGGPPTDPNGGGAPGSGPPAGSRPAPTGFTLTPGEGVKLSGTVTYSGSAKGTIRVDFLRNPEGSPYPELMHSVELTEPGPWEVEVPKNFGALMIVGFIDADNNGPSPGEPSASNREPMSVGAQPVKGIELALSDQPAMGGKGPTPPGEGGMPPEGAPGAPPAGAPPAGAVPGGAAPAGAPGGAAPASGTP